MTTSDHSLNPAASCDTTDRRFRLLLLPLALTLYCGAASGTPRNVIANHLAASLRQVAFSVQEEHSIDLVIADLNSGFVQELRSAGNRLVFPYLSADGSRLLVVRQHSDSGTSDLLSCTTDTFRCKLLYNSTNSITSPVEIDERRILFVSGQPRTDGGNLRSRYLGFSVNTYVKHDIWRLDLDQAPSRVTDFELYELGDLCVTAKNVYFHGYGPQRAGPMIPQPEPDRRPNSDVFRLPLTSGSVDLPEVQLTPVFRDEGYTTSGKVSADESLAALIRTSINWPNGGGYRYDLIIQDLQTGASRTIPPTDRLGFSRPIFVGDALFVSEIFDNKYIIKRMLPGDSSLKQALEISDGSIIHAPVIPILVDDEVH
jgi:hypothetical protein